jgi:hypothetical protein
VGKLARLVLTSFLRQLKVAVARGPDARKALPGPAHPNLRSAWGSPTVLRSGAWSAKDAQDDSPLVTWDIANEFAIRIRSLRDLGHATMMRGSGGG